MKVSVEPFLEYSVQEFTPDGQEILVRPPTVTEKLARLIRNADFDTLHEQDIDADSQTDEEAESRRNEAAASSKSATASKSAGATLKRTLLEKLRAAHIELCALCDVLTIARDGRQLAFDVVAGETQTQTQTASNVDSRATQQLQLTGKKQALARAAGILRGAADRLRRSLAADDASAAAATTAGLANAGALLELGSIRRLWRVRRVGAALLGDASFRHAGSRYRAKPGTFELLPARGGSNSNWRVVLPDEDSQAVSTLRFRLVTDSSTAAAGGGNSFSSSSRPILRRVDAKFGEFINILNEQFAARSQPQTSAIAAAITDETWCLPLRASQRTLLASELFDTFAAESRLLNGNVYGALHASLALDRSVVCALAPAVFLECSLVDEDGEAASSSSNASGNSESKSKSIQRLVGSIDLDAVLTLYATRLVRERHKSRLRRQPLGGHVATWNGVSAPGDALTFANISLRPADLDTSASSGMESTVLERMVMLSRAMLVRGRLERFFDVFARAQRESVAATRLVLVSGVHASLIGSTSATTGGVNVPSCYFAWRLEVTVDEYEATSTRIMLELMATATNGPVEFRVVATTKDGKLFETPIDVTPCADGEDSFIDMSALSAFLLAQVANHHVTVMQRLARLKELSVLDVNNACLSHAGLAAGVAFIVNAANALPGNSNTGARLTRVTVRLTCAAPFSSTSHCVVNVSVEQLETSAPRPLVYSLQLNAIAGTTLVEKVQTLTLALAYGSAR